MTTARGALLDAAGAALARRPWSAVRMADVAAAARVSRQTLYNEFGSKDGVARALVHREIDGYLAGVDPALARPGTPADRLAALAEWLVTAARGNALVRSALTGTWGAWLPAEAFAALPAAGPPPPPLPSPQELLHQVRDRAAAALAPPGAPDGRADLARSAEVALRLALSCLLAPPPRGATAELVRVALDPELSARIPTVGARSPRRSPG
ncbi:helix-turn-helix domain-containing protein [Streptomyces sp. NPDC049906]|uniref:TetR/AcrR family transcriptional regulator n=1 Tax=Streptomyces sp. NPDC049906 TaxID=3155656 RepID=UPI003444A856